MTKVLITAIPVTDTTRPPGILPLLAGCCKSIGADYAIVDLNLYMYKQFPEDFTLELSNDLYFSKFRSAEHEQAYQQVCNYYIDLIRKERPTHLAVSIFTHASIYSADVLFRAIKQATFDFDFKIVIGGTGVGSNDHLVTGEVPFGQYCLNNHLVDYCIWGEGDVAFVELLKGNDQYPGINQPNPVQLLDLDAIPLPTYEKIDPAEYFYSNEPEVQLTGSRGCVRDCTFCDVGSYWPKFVYKSGKTVATELFDIWKTTGVQKFNFTDSLVNGSIKTFREFNREIIALKEQNPGFNPRYSAQFICRPKEQLKEQDYREMAAAGAETLVVGIESFSNSVRDHMRKKFDNGAIDWHFEMSAKYGIKNALLLLAGYITETLEDHNLQLEYLRKYQMYALSRTIYTISVTMSGLIINEGSPLYNMIDELGIEFHGNTHSGDDWTSLQNPTLTSEERLRRGIELVLTAYSLGYKLLHFHQKVAMAEKQFERLQLESKKPKFQLNPV